MVDQEQCFDMIDFDDLAAKFGQDNAYAILRSLEQMEGISQSAAAKMSLEERLENVVLHMQESMHYQTRH